MTSRGRAADPRRIREVERAGAYEGCRSSADSQPDRKGVLDRARIHGLSRKGRTVFATPMNAGVLANFEQEIELLRDSAATPQVENTRRGSYAFSLGNEELSQIVSGIA